MPTEPTINVQVDGTVRANPVETARTTLAATSTAVALARWG
jgi:hypothetical protein